MEILSSRRFLNGAIVVVIMLVVGIGGYLGYQVWSQNRSISESTPLSRATQELIGQVKKNPNSIDLRLQLAQAFTAAGRDKDAVTQYEAALKIKKDFAPALSGLGFIAGRNKDWEKSEKYWRKVIQVSEKSPSVSIDKGLETAHFYLGTTLMETKRYEEAASEFKEALRMNATAADTHYLLAVTFRELDSMDAYRDELENTLALDPNMPEANYDLGNLLLENKDEAGAAERFRAAAEAAPRSDLPRSALEQFGPASDRVEQSNALLAKDAKKALVEARVAVAVDPRDASAHVALGNAYAKLKKKSKAAAAYRAALALDAGNAAAKDGLKQVDDDRS